MTYEKLYKSPILYVIIIGLGTSLRLFNINDGLWLDEIWSMSISRIEHSSFEIIEACKNDTHPPFFDLLLHYFLVLFGSNEINGRILSLIIGGIGIFSTLYYTKKITDNNISTLIATALISFSFFHIYYSSEGRFYTFLYLLSLSVICELYLFLKTKRILHIIVFVAVSTVLAYTHYYGAILLFGLALIVFFLWIIKEIDLKTFLYFVGAGILILVLYSPWLPYMLVRKSDSSWMNPPKIWAFFEYLYRYTGKNPVEFVFILFALFLSIKHFKENKMFSSIFVGIMVLGFFIPFVVSHISVPMLHYRYTFIYYPSFIILTAFYWQKTHLLTLPKKHIVYGITIISFFINFFFINKFIKGIHTEPWREVAKDIVASNTSKSYIYCEQDFHLNFYLEKYGKDISSYKLEEKSDVLWHLRTPYDKVPFQLSRKYTVDKTQEYPDGFLLTRYIILEKDK